MDAFCAYSDTHLDVKQMKLAVNLEDFKKGKFVVRWETGKEEML